MRDDSGNHESEIFHGRSAWITHWFTDLPVSLMFFAMKCNYLSCLGSCSSVFWDITIRGPGMRANDLGLRAPWREEASCCSQCESHAGLFWRQLTYSENKFIFRFSIFLPCLATDSDTLSLRKTKDLIWSQHLGCSVHNGPMTNNTGVTSSPRCSWAAPAPQVISPSWHSHTQCYYQIRMKAITLTVSYIQIPQVRTFERMHAVP